MARLIIFMDRHPFMICHPEHREGSAVCTCNREL
jgi:hypothetical protein